MKLIPILLEQEEKFDFSELDKLDDAIAQELKKAEEELEKRGELNEVGVTTVVISAATIVRIALSIYKGFITTNGLTLSKDQSTVNKVKHTNFLIQSLEKIENVVDTSVKSVVRRFVKDSAKVDKISKVLKALGIVAIIIAAQDFSNPTALASLKGAAGEIGPDLLSAVKSANITKAAEVVKNFLSNIAA